MRCRWQEVREETLLDGVGEEQRAGGNKQGGRQWSWRGKHRLDEVGRFVCSYKSHRTPRDTAKVAAAEEWYWNVQPTRDKRIGAVQHGTTLGTVCRNCLRLITNVVSYEEWIEHQVWRERNPSYGGYGVGYRPWYEPGAHPKQTGGPVGRQWAGRHRGAGKTFACYYLTVLRRELRTPSEQGGCRQCGRLRKEGK